MRLVDLESDEAARVAARLRAALHEAARADDPHQAARDLILALAREDERTRAAAACLGIFYCVEALRAQADMAELVRAHLTPTPPAAA